MAGGIQIKIEGVEETCQILRDVPKVLVTKAFFKALDAAGTVFENAILANTPIDMKAALNAAHGKRFKSKVTGEMIGGLGALVTGLDHWIVLDNQYRGGYVDSGFIKSLSHLAGWLEWGWMLTGHKPLKKQIRPIPPTGFMRKAFDRSVEHAIDVFAETLKQTMLAEYKQP